MLNMIIQKHCAHRNYEIDKQKSMINKDSIILHFKASNFWFRAKKTSISKASSESAWEQSPNK